MTTIKSLALVALSILLAACGSDDKPSADTAALFARVPADTAYVFTNTDAMNHELVYLLVAQMLTPFAGMTDTLNQFDDASGAAAGISMYRHFANKFKDIESADDVERLTGIAFAGQSLLYAVELYPVLSIALSDQGHLEALINELFTALALTPDMVDVDGQLVKAMHGNELPVALYWTSNSERATLTVIPQTLASQLLPRIFGKEYPAQALAADSINKLNRQYGFNGQGSGFFVPGNFMHALGSEDGFTAALLLQALSSTESSTESSTDTANDADDLQQFLLDPLCKAELEDIFSRIPQISGGYTQTAADGYDTRIVTRLDARTLKLVRQMLGDAPIGKDPGGAFSFAASVNTGGAIKAIRELARNTLEHPFQCAGLQDLNNTAQQIVDGLNTPMPPFIGNISGLAINIEDIGSLDLQDTSAMLESMAANFVLYTSNAEMLLGMGQMFLPQLAELDMQPGAAPQQLDLPFMGLLKQPVYAAVTEQAIGVSYGASAQDSLTTMMQGSSEMPDTMFSFGIDLQKYLSLMQDMTEQVIAESDVDEPEDKQAARALMQEAFAMNESLGHYFNTLQVTDDGLVVDSRQEILQK